MATLGTWYNVAKGAAGKALSTVGTAVGAKQLVPGGLGAQMQSQAGTALRQEYPSYAPYSAPQSVPLQSTGNYSTNKSTYQSNSNSSGGGSSGGGGGQDIINQNAGDQSSVIDQDYESTMSMLGAQEQQMMGQSAEAAGTLSAEETQVRNQLANQQTVDTQGQEAQLATGEKESATAMQQARDLFRQTQQNNIAQLSGAGLSSSSVAEALAERLGVETARRIAGVSGSIQEIRQNATKEMTRIKSYYEGKATEVTQWVGNEKMKIQNALNNSLNQINSAKQQAATAKAQARASLLSDVRTQLYTLQQQENQFQQSLKAWATQKASSLETLITDPNLVASYTANINKLNETPGISQSYIGNYGVNDQGQTGYYAGQVKSVKKDEDLLTNPFAT